MHPVTEQSLWREHVELLLNSRPNFFCILKARNKRWLCLTARACLAWKTWQYSWASVRPGLWDTKANWESTGRAVDNETLCRAWAIRSVYTWRTTVHKVCSLEIGSNALTCEEKRAARANDTTYSFIFVIHFDPFDGELDWYRSPPPAGLAKDSCGELPTRPWKGALWTQNGKIGMYSHRRNENIPKKTTRTLHFEYFITFFGGPPLQTCKDWCANFVLLSWLVGAVVCVWHVVLTYSLHCGTANARVHTRCTAEVPECEFPFLWQCQRKYPSYCYKSTNHKKCYGLQIQRWNNIVYLTYNASKPVVDKMNKTQTTSMLGLGQVDHTGLTLRAFSWVCSCSICSSRQQSSTGNEPTYFTHSKT